MIIISFERNWSEEKEESWCTERERENTKNYKLNLHINGPIVFLPCVVPPSIKNTHHFPSWIKIDPLLPLFSWLQLAIKPRKCWKTFNWLLTYYINVNKKLWASHCENRKHDAISQKKKLFFIQAYFSLNEYSRIFIAREQSFFRRITIYIFFLLSICPTFLAPAADMIPR